jgi:DNA mismatch repair protein MutS
VACLEKHVAAVQFIPRRVSDVERITARLALKSVRPRELSGLRETLTLLPELVAALPELSALLVQLRLDLATPIDCLSVLEKSIKTEPAARVQDGGVIADGYSAELDELRGLQSNGGEFLVALEAKERARTGIPNLRVAYNSVHGYYIEVTNSHTGKVPDDYRRRQTLKNADATSPELKAFEDKALLRATARSP